MIAAMLSMPGKSQQPYEKITGPKARYAALLDQGDLRADPAQIEIVDRLDELFQALRRAEAMAPPSLFQNLGFGKPKAPKASLKGLYIHGPVGRGKSMMMDLFFEQIADLAKRRVHFHAFMQEVHGRLNDLRADGKGREIERLAGLLVGEAKLLCFDEFHVQNIADAMILKRLFDKLFDGGMVMVATSNFPPHRLYENGLNRERFLPFIDRLTQEMEVVSLAGEQDYRLDRLKGVEVYHHPLSAATDQALTTIFAALTDAAAGEPDVLAIGSRQLKVPKAARGVAWFDFKTLCEQPLGAADYLALTKHYHTLILANVPLFTEAKRNEARRFMTLVDALYEARTNLVVGAEADPGSLYQAGEGAFEFQRTVSRLMAMQSQDYISTAPSNLTAFDFEPFALTTDLI